MIARSMFVATMLLAFSASDTSAAGIVAPHVTVPSINDLDVPDGPFDRYADAGHALDAAFVRAAQNHKRVLIDLGANWCADCRILAAVMALPEVAAFVNAHYEVVTVDIGRLNRNLQIPERFGIKMRLEGLPCILIASPDGALINAGHVEALAEARNMTPQSITDWLASWAG
jgi:thiol:disulfide interchange protein